MTPDCERMVKIGKSNHIMKSIERKVVPSAVKKVFYTTEGRSKDNYPNVESEWHQKVKHILSILSS
jgi:hypothetical protein